MKLHLIAFALSLFPAASHAQELPIEQNATGPWEVVVTTTATADFPGGPLEEGYKLAIRDRATKKMLGTAEDTGGYGVPAYGAAMAIVLWHPSGQFVAFAQRATKHTNELHVYSVLDNKPVRLEIPDYFKNALGQVEHTSGGFNCISKPVSWKDDVLTVSLYFSAERKDRSRHFHETTVTFALDHGKNSKPRLRLLSVAKPVDPDE